MKQRLLEILKKLRLFNRVKAVEMKLLGLAPCGGDVPIGCGMLIDVRSRHAHWRTHHEAKAYLVFCQWCVTKYDQRFPGRKVGGLADAAKSKPPMQVESRG